MISIVVDNFDLYWRGFTTTVDLSLRSFLFAFVLGTILAAFRVSPIPPLQRFAAGYVAFFRNTPLLALFFLAFFGLPALGVLFSPFVTAVIVLGLYTGAYMAETVRSGINSVSKGQVEAARALGLTFPQVLRLVVMPQALRTVVGPLGGIFIALLKNSGVAVAINVSELTSKAAQLGTDTAQFIPAFMGAAAAYLILTIPSGYATGWLERKLAIKR